MQIKIIFTDESYEFDPESFPIKEHRINIDEETTIQNILDDAEEYFADLSEYYSLSAKYSYNTKIFPYVISKSGKVRWNLSYEDTKVLDFLFTHGIEDNTLHAKTGIVQAGGPGLLDISEIWSLIYPIIDEFTTTVGFIKIVYSAGKWILNLFNKNDTISCQQVLPHIIFDFIFSRDKWNHFELGELLSIDYGDAKQLLKILGYQYDRKIMMYVKQPCTDELIKKLSEVEAFDI